MKKEDVDKMTLQQAIEYSVTKIVEQGGQCVGGMSPMGACVYDDGKGNHCSVGHLLDSEDELLMDFVGTVSDLIIYAANKLPQLIVDNNAAFTLLQRLHDHETKRYRLRGLEELSEHIDITPPIFQKWVEMGE